MFRVFNKKSKQTVTEKVKKKKLSLYDNLIYNGYKYSLTKAVDIAIAIQKQSVDSFVKDSNNSIRIKSNLTFQSRYTDICSVEGIKDGIVEIVINNSGLAGIEGTIPDAYIEKYVLYNRTSKQAILDFFDIFNHTIIITRYFFDKKQVAECLSVRVEHSLVGKIISSISGFEFDEKGTEEHCLIPRQFKISAQNLFWRYSRSADMLKVMLSSFFDVNIEVEQFVGGFSSEAPYNELTKIGVVKPAYNALGQNTLLGSKIWDSTLGITIKVKDLPLSAYIDFLPKASDKDNAYSKLTKIKEMIKMYIPNNIQAKIVFYLKAENVKGSCLSGPGRLNKDLFIGGSNLTHKTSFVEYI